MVDLSNEGWLRQHSSTFKFETHPEGFLMTADFTTARLQTVQLLDCILYNC